MPSFATHWCIGAIEDASAMTVTISSSAESIAAGSYYLYDATDARSLLAAFEDAMTSAGESTVSAIINQGGYITISAAATFTVTWTNTTLRDMLGFTGNLSGASSYTATRWSTLFWSPTYRFQTITPDNVEFNRVPDTQINMSRTGKTVSGVSNHEMEVQQFKASAVPISRVWTSNAYGGEYRVWHDTVFEAVAPFKVYDVTENTTGTSAQSLSTVMGPYKAREISHDWYNRVIANADVYSDVELEVVKVTDI